METGNGSSNNMIDRIRAFLGQYSLVMGALAIVSLVLASLIYVFLPELGFSAQIILGFAAAFLLLFWLIGGAASFLEAFPAAQTVVQYLSLSTHFGDFLRGVIDSQGVFYYLSFTATALFLAMRSVEMRRWR